MPKKYHDTDGIGRDALKTADKAVTTAIAAPAHTEAGTRDQLLNKKLTSAMTANIPTQKRQNWAAPPDTRCIFR